MSLDLKDAFDADLIIEAATENMDIKQTIFKELDAIAPKHAILATNTSSLPITEIAAVTERPEKSNRHAFYESCSCNETCRNNPWSCNSRRSI